MNPKLERIKQMAAEIREMFPGADCFLGATSYGTEMALHQCGGYSESSELLRGLGLGDREKSIFDSGGRHVCAITGKDEQSKVEVVCYANSLPPSCHIEKVTERIPKTQTVDTGEYIEVERTKVICGQEVDAK